MAGKKHSGAANHGKSRAPIARSTTPDLKVTFDPPNVVFFLASDLSMPKIDVLCEPENMPAASAGAPTPAGAGNRPQVTYDWAFTLIMSPAGIPHAKGRTIAHPPMQAKTTVGRVTIPFKMPRGGTLTVKVTATIDGQVLKGEAHAEIRGTNPTSTQIRAQGATELQLQLFKLESGLSQFLMRGHKPGYPYFSQDNLGGVGLGQLTTPRPSDDECWNWKANVRGALRLWLVKRATATRILKHYPTGKDFLRLVQAYNTLRTAQTAPGKDAQPTKAPAPALKALTITLPAVTEEMLDNETLRVYNGAPPKGGPEYVAEVDAKGVLVVDVDPDGVRGKARWHQVTGAERRQIYADKDMTTGLGDPDYVAHVRAEVVP